MKNTVPHTDVAMELLHKLSPPGVIIHIGAGTGTGLLHSWQRWEDTEAWLVDAVTSRLAWLKPEEKRLWHPLTAMVGGDDGEHSFHHASNPDESGMLPISELQSFWPSLKSNGSEQMTATRLDKLLDGAGATFRDPWLLIDCLPALPVLQGAGHWLDAATVVCVRVLLSNDSATSRQGSLQSVQSFLQNKGFLCAEVREGNHPAIGYVFYSRDWRKTAETLAADLNNARESATHIATENVALAREAQTANDRSIALAQELDTLQSQAALLKRSAEELQQQNATLALLPDRLSSLDAEFQKLRAASSALEQDKAGMAVELHQKLDVLDKTTAELKKQTQLALEHQQSLSSLNKDNAELKQQQERLSAELKKALECHNSANTALEEEKSLFGTRVQQLQQQIDSLNKANATLEQDKVALSSRLEQLQQQVTALSQVRDQLGKFATERQAQAEELIAAKEEYAVLATDAQKQIDALTKERDHHAALAVGYISEISQFKQSRETLLNDLTSMTNAHDAQSRETNSWREQAQNLQASLDDRELQLNSIRNELAQRDGLQQMLNDEITRAEAQIDLIKDVLLRESGL